MAKTQWGSAYVGKPNSLKVASNTMIIFIIILLIGFIKVAIRKDWIQPTIDFILS